MEKVTLFDPPLCCSSGVCGPDIDPILPVTAAFLDQLAKSGVEVERHNLAQNPIKFVENATVKKRIDEGGMEVLPILMIDGEIVLEGRYPDETERLQWLAQTPASA